MMEKCNENMNILKIWTTKDSFMPHIINPLQFLHPFSHNPHLIFTLLKKIQEPSQLKYYNIDLVGEIAERSVH